MTEDDRKYEVQKIDGKMVEYNGREYVYKYLVVWKDGSESWEPSYYLQCPRLLVKFEEDQKKSWFARERLRMSEEQWDLYIQMLHEEDDIDREIREKFEELCRVSPSPIAFDRNLKVRKIINAFEYKGKVIYVVAWKTIDKVDPIPAKICNVRIPQAVIRYLESKLLIMNMNGETIRWGIDEDEDYNSPWGESSPNIVERQNIDYGDYERVSLHEIRDDDEDDMMDDEDRTEEDEDVSVDGDRTIRVRKRGRKKRRKSSVY